MNPNESISDTSIDALLELVPELCGKVLAISPLGGGLTNRNYRIDSNLGSYVLRIFPTGTALLGIDRDCEAHCARAAAALGVGAEVMAHLVERGALVTRFIPGRVLTPEDIQEPVNLQRLAEALRRFHCGPARAGSFSPFKAVRNYRTIICERNGRVPLGLDEALGLLTEIEAMLQTDEPTCPCHNDLLASNCIDDGRALKIIDWEYAGLGDRFFDLGNLAANNEFNDDDERALLEAYFGEVRPDDWRRLRLMRLASDMREAMWGFLQAAVSSLDIDYVSYGQKHLDRFNRERIRLV